MTRPTLQFVRQHCDGRYPIAPDVRDALAELERLDIALDARQQLGEPGNLTYARTKLWYLARRVAEWEWQQLEVMPTPPDDAETFQIGDEELFVLAVGDHPKPNPLPPSYVAAVFADHGGGALSLGRLHHQLIGSDA